MSEEGPIRIELRPILTSAVLVRGPDYWKILVCPSQPKDEAAITMWHEVVHMLRYIGGNKLPLEQDEAEVEAAAKKLAKACPEILQWCGIEEHFYEPTVEESRPELPDGCTGEWDT